MATSLYRKYRPQKWADISNQNHVKVTLQNEIETDKLAHAYLFAGPRGVGKTTTARIFAKSVNCANLAQERQRLAAKLSIRRSSDEIGAKADKTISLSEPCNKCRSCTEISEGRALDLIEIDAASHTGVDHVREHIIASARFVPTSSPFKIFIIDEVHMLSISAFNALLKILEEPPPRIIFIFATTEPFKLPPTIISRCQRFDFKKIIHKEIVDRLSFIISEEGIDVPREILETIAKHADGFVRDAEGILGQVLALGEGNKVTREQAELILPKSVSGEVIDFLSFLFDKNIPESLRFISKFQEAGGDLNYFSLNLIESLRKILISKIGASAVFDLEDEETNKVQALIEKTTLKEIAGVIELFLQAKEEMKNAFILQLPLELAVVKYCTA